MGWKGGRGTCPVYLHSCPLASKWSRTDPFLMARLAFLFVGAGPIEQKAGPRLNSAKTAMWRALLRCMFRLVLYRYWAMAEIPLLARNWRCCFLYSRRCNLRNVRAPKAQCKELFAFSFSLDDVKTRGPDPKWVPSKHRWGGSALRGRPRLTLRWFGWSE